MKFDNDKVEAWINAVDQSLVGLKSTTQASIVFSFTVLILQFASPFFCRAILRQLAPQAALRGAASLGSSIKGGLK